MSPHQATFGAGAVNARLMRSGAAAPVPWRVRLRRRRLARAVGPRSAMSCAIVLSETCPSLLAQLDTDARAAVGAARVVEHLPDLGRQPGTPITAAGLRGTVSS